MHRILFKTDKKHCRELKKDCGLSQICELKPVQDVTLQLFV